MVTDYRSNDTLALVAEHEVALAQAADERRRIERELYAARRSLRRRRTFSALRTAGFGALAGNFLGGIGWVVTGSAGFVVFGAAFLTLFTFIVAHVWNPLDGEDEAPLADAAGVPRRRA